MFENYRTRTSCFSPFSHFSLSPGLFSCHPICSHPECNCAIWLWFLYHVPPCFALPVNPHWSVSNLQVSQAFGELPGDKVLFHKSAQYTVYFSWFGAHRMGLGRRMDQRIRNINRGATSISIYWDCKYWYAACLISHLFFSSCHLIHGPPTAE